jgi:hypothetical protein
MLCFPNSVSGLLTFLHSAICDNINMVTDMVGFEVGRERDVSPALEPPTESVPDRS